MPQGLGGDSEGDVGGDGDGRGEVAQVVDRGARYSCLTADQVEVVEDVFGVEGAAARAVEDEIPAR